MALDSSNPQTLYTSTGDKIWKSTDGGASWTASSSGLTNSHVECLDIDPNNSQVIYAGTYQGGIWKSSDGGASWADFSDGLAYSNVSSLAIDPNNSQVIYAGTYDEVFKSINDETASSTGLTNSHDVVGTFIGVGAVCKSSDGGANWADFSSGLPNSPVSVAIDSSGVLYAKTGAKVFRMTPKQ
jgi:photosystem II stability/assembly factor-like uncharacterized protein